MSEDTIIVRAKIKDEYREWIEEFEVCNKESAEEFIRTVVKQFNDTLRPNEPPREFVGIVDTIDKEHGIKTIRDLINRANTFASKVKREAFNAAGNRWCHEKEDEVIHAFDKLITRHRLAAFQALIQDSPYREDFADILAVKKWKDLSNDAE